MDLPVCVKPVGVVLRAVRAFFQVNVSLPIHPSLRRAYETLEPLFKEHIITEEVWCGCTICVPVPYSTINM